MKKYSQIVNNETGLCNVGLGDNEAVYIKLGFEKMDVKQSDIDGLWYLEEKCPMKTEVEKEQEERNRLDSLSLTAADVERAIYKACGLDFEDIVETVQNNPNVDVKALKIELKANNFYRGNPYINQIGAILGFSATQLDNFFEKNDYLELTK